jgi:triosephosphate isomerase
VKKKICAGNWKLHKTPKESAEFLEEFFAAVSEEDLSSFVVLPPASNWFVFSAQQKLAWGAQNLYQENSGAFTGENSASTLKEMGGAYALVGHSERRHVFGEPEEWMARKVLCLQERDLTPILCVGETLDEREAGKTEEVIGGQLNSVLHQIPAGSKLWVAYEPVWAIGTGKVASPEQAGAAHDHLRGLLEKAWGPEKAGAVPLLYGGSVKPENAGNLAAQSNIDGFLIGGASLKVETFLGIFRAAHSSI